MVMFDDEMEDYYDWEAFMASKQYNVGDLLCRKEDPSSEYKVLGFGKNNLGNCAYRIMGYDGIYFLEDRDVVKSTRWDIDPKLEKTLRFLNKIDSRMGAEKRSINDYFETFSRKKQWTYSKGEFWSECETAKSLKNILDFFPCSEIDGIIVHCLNFSTKRKFYESLSEKHKYVSYLTYEYKTNKGWNILFSVRK